MAKQLSLPERYVIERMLHQDYSFASIGRNLDRSASTIAREVLHYRCFTSRIPIEEVRPLSTVNSRIAEPAAGTMAAARKKKSVHQKVSPNTEETFVISGKIFS